MTLSMTPLIPGPNTQLHLPGKQEEEEEIQVVLQRLQAAQAEDQIVLQQLLAAQGAEEEVGGLTLPTSLPRIPLMAWGAQCRESIERPGS